MNCISTYQTLAEGDFPFTEEFQLINTKGTRERECNHFVTCN
jgi:hypothetical protein